MIEPLFIVTNNPMSKEKFEKKYRVEFIDAPQLDILKNLEIWVLME